MSCNSLKEAIDITFEKYNQEKNEANYSKILNLLLQGYYNYITSDKGARNFVLQLDLPSEIDFLYEEVRKGKAGVLDIDSVSMAEKIAFIANDYAHFTKENSKVEFGTLSNKIDSLSIENKTDYLYSLINGESEALGLSSGDIKRLVVENSYRLLRIHLNRSGNIVLDLYSDNNCPVSERVNISNQVNTYLVQLFAELKPEQLSNFINNLDAEQMYFMCNLYSVTRRDFKNSNKINMADKLSPTKETIDIFYKFSDEALSKELSNNGISY